VDAISLSRLSRWLERVIANGGFAVSRMRYCYASGRWCRTPSSNARARWNSVAQVVMEAIEHRKHVDPHER